MSLRDQILNAEDVESEIVVVDGWGGARVEVRSMSTAMREKLSQFAGEGDTESWTAAVVIATCYDPETGEERQERPGARRCWLAAVRDDGRGEERSGKSLQLDPRRRFIFELAQSLHRTVDELLLGSPAHRPLSSAEFTHWLALYEIRAAERK